MPTFYVSNPGIKVRSIESDSSKVIPAKILNGHEFVHPEQQVFVLFCQQSNADQKHLQATVQYLDRKIYMPPQSDGWYKQKIRFYRLFSVVVIIEGFHESFATRGINT